MTSRKKRKRDRRRAEATAQAKSQKLRGGWGPCSELALRDLDLVRLARREKWNTDRTNLHLIYDQLIAKAFDEETNNRELVSICRLLLDCDVL